jgi:hypothetical protein
MALTCLQIAQSVCRRIGLNPPTAIVTSQDSTMQQVLEMMNEEGQALAEMPWQSLQTEASFTTVAAQTQGTISTIAPGFNYIVNDTIWNRTLRRPVYGPKSEQDWQQAKAMNINGPFNSFRIAGDLLIFNPIPVAGQSCYFEFISTNWLNTGSTTAAVWTTDADTPRVDDQLIVLGAIWRWKAAKGLSFEADFDKYEKRRMDRLNRDGGKPTLNMIGAKYDIQPGVFIPAGSFGQ